MNQINIQHLSKSYAISGQTIQALNNVDITLESGSFTVLVGPSGCGKTTLLRILAGLEEPTRGKIDLPLNSDGSPQKIGVVFQEPRLMPWLTVQENIQMAKTNDGDQKAKELIALLGLTGFEDAYPRQLSGGMAQRTALGRTLYQNPDIILMDEPFASLDYLTRIQLQEELLHLFLQTKKTILFVTHDVEEAAYLGQQLLIMNHGQIAADYPLPTEFPRKRHSELVNIIKRNLLGILQVIQKEKRHEPKLD